MQKIQQNSKRIEESLQTIRKNTEKHKIERWNRKQGWENMIVMFFFYKHHGKKNKIIQLKAQTFTTVSLRCKYYI